MKEGMKMVKLELVAEAVIHPMPAIFMYHALLEAGGLEAGMDWSERRDKCWLGPSCPRLLAREETYQVSAHQRM